MSAPAEFLRGLVTLGYFFGAAPIVGLQILARRGGLMDARQPAFAHGRRARRLGGIDYEINGEENFPATGGYVLVYNEASVVETIVNSEVVWRRSERNVMAAEFAYLPLFSQLARRTGMVMVKRGNRASADRMLDELASYASSGGRVAIAPQGRMAPEGVGRFKRGGFLIAIRAGVPVIPMAIRGGLQIMAPWSLRMRRGTLHYRVGKPISVDGLTDEDAPALAERVQAVVARMYADM
jgi:1-acyl-sn-glycerol-3-phosphate acyltransferase